MSSRLLVAALLAGATFVIQAQEVMVFGQFLLGGKGWFTKVCPTSLIDRNVKDVCWLEKLPKNYNGQRAGTILLPKETLPTWAELSTFELWFQGEVLQRVKLRVFVEDEVKIVKSISERFGKPIDVSLADPSAKWVTWERSEITIKYVCGSDWCDLYFISAEMRATMAKQQAERNRKDAVRPRTP